MRSLPDSPKSAFPSSSSPSTKSTSSSGSGSGRGRGTSQGVQSRRSAVSLGLGVSFAPLVPTSSSTSSTSTSSPAPRIDSPATTSHPSLASSSTSSSSSSIITPPSSRPHSRHPSISHSPSIPFTTTASSSSSSSEAPTPSASRHASRRPSLSHLSSFLSGIEHHTRVRSPGVSGGRGVSRSGSRSGNNRREERGRTGGSRRSSVSWDEEGDWREGEGNVGGGGEGEGLERSTGSLWELSEVVNEGVATTTTTTNNTPTPTISTTTGGGATKKTWQPLSTPRILSTEPEEEPFLETAPSSPNPNHRQNSISISRIRSYESNYSHAGGGGGGGNGGVVRVASSTDGDGSANALEGVEVFDEGERVGVGVWLEGRGGWVRDCFGDEVVNVVNSAGGVKEPTGAGVLKGPGNGVDGPGELEIVRRLGEGTYAIVYLVREVLYDPDSTSSSSSANPLSPIDPYASFQFDPSRPSLRSWSSDLFDPPEPITYGRSFALKCLCKKDLNDELVMVQRGEAVLHRKLPDHDFIVRLYGAYETDDWLFLVLEYCPGQDLFYWLDERADDSVELYDLHSRAASPFQRHGSTSPASGMRKSIELDRPDDDESALSRTITSTSVLQNRPNGNGNGNGDDHTPPSPSLLATTANSSLLSRKRLRLISRMFGQMCSAVQACHDVGISHRDIKPENFIVSSTSTSSGGEYGKVVVKITDWGLGTSEEECEDFDCGSKPYMAYECRNNLRPSYDPKQADVWSLGLVLLNLLYHRNPWADPSLDDPDFREYVRDPRGFLQDRFEGIGEDVAGFLADRVFCDVLEMEGDSLRRRVSAGDFGKWASRLVFLMGEGKRKRASVSDLTFSLVSSVSRPGQPIAPPAASLLSQSLTHSPCGADDDLPPDLKEELPKVDEESPDPVSTSSSRPAPLHFFDPDDEPPLPSPSFPPNTPKTTTAALSIGSPTVAVIAPVAAVAAIDKLSAPGTPEPIDTPRPVKSASQSPVSDEFDSGAPNTPTPGLRPRLDDHDRVNSGYSGRSTSSRDDDGEGAVRCWGEPETQNPKSKRRKRGARKSKKTPGEASPPLPVSSPALATVDEQRDILADLAAASQDLARELSMATNPVRAHPPRPSRTLGTQSTSALRTMSSVGSLTDKPVAKAGGGGVFGRMKSLVKDGNPDLLAFKQHVEARNASIGAKADTYSAPAKMQGRGSHGGGSYDVGMSSWGSAGLSSRGSYSGVEGDDAPRGRADPSHWSSASTRRERIDKKRAAASPSSSTANGTLSTSTFDSRNHTPLSSFSSVSSTDYSSSNHLPNSVATIQNWRQSSPHRRPYSSSRAPYRVDEHGAGSERSTSSRVTTVPKPTLKDAAVDTADLDSPLSSSPTPAAPVPPKPTPPTPSRTSSTTTTETINPNPQPKNKLGRLFNLISVSNTNREK